MRFSSTLRGVLALSILLVPLAALAATNADVEFRLCMQTVMNNRENRFVDLTRNYHANWLSIISDRRTRYFNAWSIDVDKDRNGILRDIERETNAQLRDNDRSFRDESRTITNDFRNESRACSDALRDRDGERRKVPVGRRCFGTDECYPPLGICTIEFGDCRMTCRPNSRPCENICAGTCILR